MNWKNRLLTVAELLDAFRFVPRVVLVSYAILVWQVVQWYMDIAEPTTQHAALVTVVVSVIAPIVGLYQSSGRKWGNPPD